MSTSCLAGRGQAPQKVAAVLFVLLMWFIIFAIVRNIFMFSLFQFSKQKVNPHNWAL
jgi:hypothetical protein